MVLRAARRVLEAARQHILKEAVDGADSGEAAAGIDGQAISLGVAVRLSGCIQVHEVRQGDIARLRQLLGAWQQQPCFSFAVITDVGMNQGTEGSSEGLVELQGMLRGVPAVMGLCVCWSPREVVLVEVPPTLSSHSSSYAVELRDRLKIIFADHNKKGICWDCCGAIASLQSVCGWSVATHLDDPLAALRVLHPDMELGSDGDLLAGPALLKAARYQILPDYHMRIMGQHDTAVVAALQQASLSWVMAPVLHSMLASKQLLGVYESLAMAAVRAVGDAHKSWVKVDVQALREAVTAGDQALQVLATGVARDTGLVLGRPDDVYAILSSLSCQPRDAVCSLPPEQAVLKVMKRVMQAGQGPCLALHYMLCYCRVWQAREEAKALMCAATSADVPGGGLQWGSVCRLWLRPSYDVLCGCPSNGTNCLAVQGGAVPAYPVEVCTASLQQYDTVALLAAVASCPLLVLTPYGQLAYLVEVKQQPVPAQSGSTWQGYGGAEGTCAVGRVRWVDGLTMELRESMHVLALLHEVRLVGSSSSSSSTSGLAAAPAVAAAAWSVQLTTRFWSLRQSLSPSDQSRLFVGMDLSQLNLLTLVLSSGDAQLVTCCTADDPLGDAAAKWADSCPCAAIAAAIDMTRRGSLQGVQVTDEVVALKAVFREVLASVMAGHRPSQLAEVLGVVTTLAAALQEGVMQAFPGVKALLQRIITSCEKSG
jgi:hypothetical protein